MPSKPEILLERRGAAGIATLNRPAALNAVTGEMVRALHAALDRWRNDGAVSRVIVVAAGGRAFSAGGDLRRIYEAGRAGRQEESIAFWHEEYTLNTVIRHYPKPYVALIDGIVMGGGVGVSVHGSHRVAGDRFQFAMPEVGIGFFPDVGATWFLPRMPGETGTYCALTGERLGPSDALAAGIVTHRIATARFPNVVEALCGAVSVDAILAAFAEPVAATATDAFTSPRLRGEVDRAKRGRVRGPVRESEPVESPPHPGPLHSPSKTGVNALMASGEREKGRASVPVSLPRGNAEQAPVMTRRSAIDRIFAAGSVEDILTRLDAEAATASSDAQWARDVAAAIRTKAPLSLKIALEQMRRGRHWSFAECMQAEFRIVSRVAYGHDFYEGIRAVIIDKDNRPQWHPATLAEVTPEMVERYFAPLEAELALP
ncbi:MAG TPA: enoyl-CoA hydratase/isomerase family protein [Xanthobacteraceae bacterium]|nr:enoyl-CoA hydratase/isomerase family protein [Xanthobacteraceae bacterium]